MKTTYELKILFSVESDADLSDEIGSSIYKNIKKLFNTPFGDIVTVNIYIPSLIKIEENKE